MKTRLIANKELATVGMLSPHPLLLAPGSGSFTMKMRFAFTDDGSLVAKAIRRVTGGEYSHCLIEFLIGDNRCYFESRSNNVNIIIGYDQFGNHKYIRKNGIRGPLPMSKLHSWYLKSEKRKMITFPSDGWLPVTDEEVQWAYSMLCEKRSHVRYAHTQIIRNLFENMFGSNFGWKRTSPNTWTCSETALETMPRKYWHYFLPSGMSPDAIVPSGMKNPSILEGAKRLVEDRGVKE